MPPGWRMWPGGTVWKPRWRSTTACGMCSRYTAANWTGPPTPLPLPPTTSGIIWQTDFALQQRLFSHPGPAFYLPLQFRGPAAIPGRGLELQGQRAFSAQTAGPFRGTGLVLGETPLNIGGNPRIQGTRSGAHQVKKPAFSHRPAPAPDF